MPIGELPQDLAEAIDAVQDLKTGDEMLTLVYRGFQSERLQTRGEPVPWSTIYIPLDPQTGEPTISDEEAGHLAVLDTLNKVAQKLENELDNPYQVMCMGGNAGIDFVDLKPTLRQYNKPPALFSPYIWHSRKQIEANPILRVYDPLHWDQDTELRYDPREVEEQIAMRFGPQALDLTKQVMLLLASTDQAQIYLNRMEHKMRVPKVMMRIQSAVFKADNFPDFIDRIITTMEEEYKDEAFLLGDQGNIMYQMKDMLQRLRFTTYRFGSDDSPKMSELDELLAAIRVMEAKSS